MKNLRSWISGFRLRQRVQHTRPGKRLHNLWIITMFNGKVHYQWAIFNSYFDITRGYLCLIPWQLSFFGKQRCRSSSFLAPSEVTKSPLSPIFALGKSAADLPWHAEETQAVQHHPLHHPDPRLCWIPWMDWDRMQQNCTRIRETMSILVW